MQVIRELIGDLGGWRSVGAVAGVCALSSVAVVGWIDDREAAEKALAREIAEIRAEIVIIKTRLAYIDAGNESRDRRIGRIEREQDAKNRQRPRAN